MITFREKDSLRRKAIYLVKESDGIKTNRYVSGKRKRTKIKLEQKDELLIKFPSATDDPIEISATEQLDLFNKIVIDAGLVIIPTLKDYLLEQPGYNQVHFLPEREEQPRVPKGAIVLYKDKLH